MRYKVIACRVFHRELALLSAKSDTVLDITWIRQGLHNYPDLLRVAIQEAIDRTEAPPEGPDAITGPPEPYQAIILGFGLCSLAIAGLRSKRLPLVVPRSHDCVGVLLGSNARYREEFERAPGTYWFSPGWVEEATFPVGEQREVIRRRLSAQYGEENSDYLVNFQRDSLADYTRAAYVSLPELDRDRYHTRVGEIASDFGWAVEVLPGDLSYLGRILNGTWNEAETLVCAPGMEIQAEFDTDGGDNATGNSDHTERIVYAREIPDV